MSELSDRYSHAEVEDRIYKWWEESGHFKAEDRSTKPPFSIILPPPNVTGFLHMGHALDHTIQDVLVRWKRMSGFNTLWMPGTDHAGIATQSVVEKELRKEGTNRLEMGREKFLERVWDWKKQYGDRIYKQMRRLGDSVDWDREVFTLDDNVSKAVRKVFVSLYKKGQIYKGTRLVNWSPPLETAISDLEVEYKEQKGSLWHLDYPVEGTDAKLTVATTRPETMLGDTAVAVHPEDERYKDFIGKNVILPLTGRKIPIIADEYVEREFGTGVVKITPAHDFNDYEIGKRHDLEFINLLNIDGTLNENAAQFKGLKTQEARKQVVKALEDEGALNKIEPYKNKVGYCSRSGAVVEPYLSEQWFMNVSEVAVPARHVVENGSTVFEPEQWTKTYLHWMNILEDWCISRQLWWGHRIPAWYCKSCQHVTVSETDPTECESCKSKELDQDSDVLDTWFSSALWPFSTMGWPQETETLKTFYPTNVLVTGHDIIFFWVARMMMMGLEFKEDVPFRKVYIHGLIRDSQGRKMSKSLGNSIDPVELIENYGADSLRFTLMSSLAAGRDIKFSQQRLEGYRNFMNKIWNATRFALGALKDFEVPAEGVNALPSKSNMSVADQWIVFKTQQIEEDVNRNLEQMNFQEAAQNVYSFVWHEFCDWYLEFVKPVVYGDASDDRKASQLVLAQTLNRIMRLLHPFIPFITEELYAKLPIKSEALIVEEFPTPEKDAQWLSLGSEEAAKEMEMVKDVISAIRNIKGENRIKPNIEIDVRLAPFDDTAQKILGSNKVEIMRLGRLKTCEIGEEGNLSKCAVTPVHSSGHQISVIVPLEGLVDIEEEIKRINKSMEKIQKDIGVLTKKLGNENFVKNAPEDLVAADKELLSSLKTQLSGLQESLNRLS